ncbi:uncharacterized protein B0H18DRAFT_85665 [Fomitopsis serialis]|uniref:uncharacterized protein n=1 Tax=Fomitopsis serialis TaxID=139415 RepID=UPI0020077AB0|nr:uncharacterized protein B0H18DRAFT_85665 [Neoantrodia serialis]KAH9931488.1 hypothetical protein B0H18DRAFT_85665 [Neoantrodia serialis]
MFRSAFRILSQLLVSGYALVYMATLMWGHMRGLCQYPMVSSLVRSCDVFNSNLTAWAALPLLLGAQISGMENVLNQTDANANIMADLLETRIAAIDLSLLVRASSLEHRSQLSTAIEKLADDALDLNRALQHLAAKIGTGFDRIMSTNDHLSRLLRSSSAHTGDLLDIRLCQMGIGADTCPASSSYPADITDAYVHSLSTYEAVLRDLLQYTMVSLTKAAVFDEDLLSAMHVVAQEKLEVDIAKRELGAVWALLRSQSRSQSLAHLAHNVGILNSIGDYSMRALRYVQAVQGTLESMQCHVEELRMVASGALVSEGASTEVVLEMLAKGLERVRNARAGAIHPALSKD